MKYILKSREECVRIARTGFNPGYVGSMADYGTFTITNIGYRRGTKIASMNTGVGFTVRLDWLIPLEGLIERWY